MFLKNYNSLIRTLFVASAILMVGCKDKIIQEQDMVKILVNTFVTDATVAAPQLAYRFHRKDSIEYYQNFYESLGYTKDEFEKSVDYYLQNPAILDKMLDRVISELARIETEIGSELASKQLKQDMKDMNNLWKGKKVWTLPREGAQATVDFKFELKGYGEYIIIAEVTVYSNDESDNPAMTSWFCYDDGSEEGYRVNIKSEFYIKDGETRTVTLTNVVEDTLSTHIAGSLMHHDPKRGDWKKRSSIRNVSLIYNPLPTSRIADPMQYSRDLPQEQLRIRGVDKSEPDGGIKTEKSKDLLEKI